MMKTNFFTQTMVKFIIEGEEEYGSVSLAGFLEENKRKLLL